MVPTSAATMVPSWKPVGESQLEITLSRREETHQGSEESEGEETSHQDPSGPGLVQLEGKPSQSSSRLSSRGRAYGRRRPDERRGLSCGR